MDHLSMAEAKILKGSTQTLVSYPRVSAGGSLILAQPTSVEVQITTPASTPATVDTFASATVDTLSTTTSSDAAEGAVRIPLATALETFKGRSYLVENEEGTVHVVECGYTTDDNDIWLAGPLLSAVESGSLVKGWACSKALTSAQTATCGNGTATWKAVIDGVTYQWAQSFRVVRRIVSSTLTPQRLIADAPALIGGRGRNDLNLEKLIDAAWRHEVLPLLHARGIKEEDIVSVEELEPLHLAACLVLHYRSRQDVDGAFFERQVARLEQLKETTFVSDLWWDYPQNDTAAPRPEANAGKPSGIRMSR
jgi:hypothetical protein